MKTVAKLSESRIRSFRLYGETPEEAADFWLHCETLPERTHLHNWEIDQHRHDGFFQVFCVTAGSGQLLGPDGLQLLDAPCALFIPPGAVHGFRFSRDVDGFVFTALADRLASPMAADRRIADFAARSRIVPLTAGPEGHNAGAALEAVRLEIATPAIGHAVLLEAQVTAAIVALARAADTADATGQPAGDRDGRRIEKLLDLVAAHYRSREPVTFYANRIGVSPTHLNRLSRARLGLSVQELVARRVLDAARRDLVFTPTPVQTIAYALGFSDPAYFNRFFRRMTDKTPGAYRESERNRLAILTSHAAASDTAPVP